MRLLPERTLTRGHSRPAHPRCQASAPGPSSATGRVNTRLRRASWERFVQPMRCGRGVSAGGKRRRRLGHSYGAEAYGFSPPRENPFFVKRCPSCRDRSRRGKELFLRCKLLPSRALTTLLTSSCKRIHAASSNRIDHMLLRASVPPGRKDSSPTSPAVIPDGRPLTVEIALALAGSRGGSPRTRRPLFRPARRRRGQPGCCQPCPRLPARRWRACSKASAPPAARGLEIPVVLYTYLNPAYAYGFERFLQASADAGVDGVLILDLPPDEAGRNAELAHRPRRAQDDPPHRAEHSRPTGSPLIAGAAEGFVYFVSREGVTGERAKASPLPSTNGWRPSGRPPRCPSSSASASPRPTRHARPRVRSMRWWSAAPSCAGSEKSGLRFRPRRADRHVRAADGRRRQKRFLDTDGGK